MLSLVLTTEDVIRAIKRLGDLSLLRHLSVFDTYVSPSWGNQMI